MGPTESHRINSYFEMEISNPAWLAHVGDAGMFYSGSQEHARQYRLEHLLVCAIDQYGMRSDPFKREAISICMGGSGLVYSWDIDDISTTIIRRLAQWIPCFGDVAVLHLIYTCDKATGVRKYIYQSVLHSIRSPIAAINVYARSLAAIELESDICYGDHRAGRVWPAVCP